MQLGQVPIIFVPETSADVTQAIAMETETADIAIPSLAPFMPAPVAAPAPTVPPWAWVVLGLGVLWLMTGRRR